MKTDLLSRLRETKFLAAEVDGVRLDGTFSGFASIFDEVDLGNDAIRPGAFSRSLERRGAAGIRMLFQHDPAQPIGTWQTLRETGRGLEVRGRLALETVRGREIHALMRAGALDGLSIGFRTVKARQDPVSGVRRILEADLWEISVVTFPMQESARITNVKGATAFPAGGGQLPTIREFERWLVRDAGLSRREAQRVIAKGYRQACEPREVATGSNPLAARIRAAADLLHSRTKVKT